jgi:hypothetical protein
MDLRIALACFLACGLVSRSLAQTAPPQAVPQALPPAAAAVAAPVAQTLSSAELDALVAPIALYPDTLLAQVLMASTYPLEVVQADRWLAANNKLQGDKLKAAAEQQPWDASVKSLVATPSVLEMMSKNLDWTQKLGDAVLAQQPDVMDGVQRMRARAYDARKLSSGAQQTVTVRQESGKQVIQIEPTQPDTLYVPYYDPAVAYGSWPYPAYPPYYFPAPGYIATGVLATGLAFGTAYALGRWSSGNYWGGNVNWGNSNINIDRNRVTHWEHNPQHRHGVQYRNNAVQQKFGGNNLRSGSEARMDFRGRGGDQVLRPEGGRGDLGAGGARPEQRVGDRTDVANRPDRGPGDRAGAGNRADRPGRDARAGGDGPREQGARAGTQPRRPEAGARRPGAGRDSAFGNVQQGRAANLQSQRGQASLAHARGGGGPRAMHAGGPGMGRGAAMNRGGGMGRGAAMSRGGGMSRGGMGGGRGGGRGCGRRSDIRLKHDVVLLGTLDSGLGLYRFAYGGSDTRYVGVIAQEVLGVAPWAVSRGADGYLRVDYRLLGVPFQSFEQWRASATPSLVTVGGAD